MDDQTDGAVRMGLQVMVMMQAAEIYGNKQQNRQTQGKERAAPVAGRPLHLTGT
jgi:hypothetical protein